MRFMVMHKMTPALEAGGPPDPEVMAAIDEMIGEAVQQQSFLGGEGLRPSRERLLLDYRGGQRTVLEYPFGGRGQLPAGYAILKVGSKDEAVAACDRFAAAVGDVSLWLGPVVEPWDLGFGEKPAGAPLRFLAMHEADAHSEADELPDAALMEKMGALVAAMQQEGVLDTTGGLASTRHGARVRIRAGKPAVLDGPFAESKELIAGYALLELPSKAAAIEAAIRFGLITKVDEVDIRLVAG